MKKYNNGQGRVKKRHMGSIGGRPELPEKCGEWNFSLAPNMRIAYFIYRNTCSPSFASVPTTEDERRFTERYLSVRAVRVVLCSIYYSIVSQPCQILIQMRKHLYGI
jgi:hypothetical protein